MKDVYMLQNGMAMHVGRVRTNYLPGQTFRLKSCLYPLLVVKSDASGIYCACKDTGAAAPWATVKYAPDGTVSDRKEFPSRLDAMKAAARLGFDAVLDTASDTVVWTATGSLEDRPGWADVPGQANPDGTPAVAERRLAHGCELVLEDGETARVQAMTLTLRFKDVDYSKTVSRVRPSPVSVPESRLWAETEAASHLGTLAALVVASAKALTGNE